MLHLIIVLLQKCNLMQIMWKFLYILNPKRLMRTNCTEWNWKIQKENSLVPSCLKDIYIAYTRIVSRQTTQSAVPMIIPLCCSTILQDEICFGYSSPVVKEINISVIFFPLFPVEVRNGGEFWYTNVVEAMLNVALKYVNNYEVI